MRYFALYPLSAKIHVFMSEFLDDKDNGTAILSHFYLLTGSSITLWLQNKSSLLNLTGVITLGVGDALASIIGKKYGKHCWTKNSSKTIEGSIAFAISVTLSAIALLPFEKFNVSVNFLKVEGM